MTVFLDISLQGMHGICCHVSAFLITPTPTHNDTASYFEGIDFWFVDFNNKHKLNYKMWGNIYSNSLAIKMCGFVKNGQCEKVVKSKGAAKKWL